MWTFRKKLKAKLTKKHQRTSDQRASGKQPTNRTNQPLQYEYSQADHKHHNNVYTFATNDSNETLPHICRVLK